MWFPLALTSDIMTIGKKGAGGVLPTLRRQFNDVSRSQVMAGDSTSANDYLLDSLTSSALGMWSTLDQAKDISLGFQLECGGRPA